MKQDGFTLVELLTVVSVLGIMTLGVLTTLNPVEQILKGHDLQRKSDLAQIQRALESYYNDNGKYPTASGNAISVASWGSAWNPYMPKVPKDIQDPARKYVYWTDATNQSYRLCAALERGTKDPQASAVTYCATVLQIDCGANCNYGVSSSNITP